MLTTNRPATLAQLYRFVTRADPNDAKTRYGDLARAVNRAALMREAAIKSTIFVGVPRVSILVYSFFRLHRDPGSDLVLN